MRWRRCAGHAPLVTEENKNLVLGLLFVAIVFLAVLVSGIKWFRPARSIWGLLLGLARRLHRGRHGRARNRA